MTFARIIVRGNHGNQDRVFKGKSIRKTILKNEWWFAVVDVVEVLADSSNPVQYIKKMRSRDPQLQTNWGTICTPLEKSGQPG